MGDAEGMDIHPTPLAGSALIDLKRLTDDRGFFARAFCEQEFVDAGLDPTISQCNLSYNHEAGTLRGFHYQLEPNAEVKVIRCVRGAIYDVIVDLRPDSDTYLQWFGAELSQDNYRAMYVPRNFAHAYLTLTPDATTIYQVSTPYTPGAERGLRWNDPALDVDWPVEIAHISDKDANWPLLADNADFPAVTSGAR
ncbi:dTDP-4-dehydrorhamnose 3,5-epimerase [Pseudonocardia autotrophica]|uniref:dTDP-4-dehydrorhamnose 3,5-epimerase n=2 Tax=Pseudonocardia TaxID=1847 RepID=A0A1Y2N9B7_PSEAH|nr:dTDP-4-dehydrorhamnose 3,5-epimerase [Pseudonocardia autotrophica]TDN73363.1 dTDP-4-dehydrorhamnose 3,5-epimerase [Pseudonocardia autotrophica]